MDGQKRVTLSLNLGMPEERALYEAYRSLPRSRAQEFLRRCMMMGFLSRKRSLMGYLEQSLEPLLKTNHQDDMISRSERTPVWRAHEHSRKALRRPFMSEDALPPTDFRHEAELSEPEGRENQIARTERPPTHDQREEQHEKGGLDARAKSIVKRTIGWKRPSEKRDERAPTNPVEKDASIGQSAEQLRVEHEQTSPDEASRLEERLLHSIGAKTALDLGDRDRPGNPSIQGKDETERSDETGSSGGAGSEGSDGVRESRGSGGTSAGKGANLLKGFFGEE